MKRKPYITVSVLTIAVFTVFGVVIQINNDGDLSSALTSNVDQDVVHEESEPESKVIPPPAPIEIELDIEVEGGSCPKPSEVIGSGKTPEYEVDKNNHTRSFLVTLSMISILKNPDKIIALLKVHDSLPDLGTTIILTNDSEPLGCQFKVVRHYHVNNDKDMPADEFGCVSKDNSNNCVFRQGDQFYWKYLE